MKFHIIIILVFSILCTTNAQTEDSAKYWYDKAIEYSTNESQFSDNSDLALLCINKSLALDASDPAAWMRKGIILDALGKSNDAVECYDKAIILDQFNEDGWKKKGDTLFSEGWEASIFNGSYPSIQSFHERSKLDPALKHTSTREFYENALDCYNEVLEINPLDAEVWTKKGFVLDGLNDQYEATKCYNSAIRIDSYVAEYQWHIRSVNLRNALVPFMQVISMDFVIAKQDNCSSPERNEIECSNTYNEIILNLDRASEIDEKYANFWKRYCLIFGKNCTCGGPIECYENANPMDFVWCGKGIALMKLGKYNDSIEFFENAIERNPNRLEAWGNKARALQALGLKDEADIAFGNANGRAGLSSSDGEIIYAL